MNTRRRTHAVGIDVGGTRTKCGLVEFQTGRVIGLEVTPTPRDSAEAFLACLSLSIDRLRTALAPGALAGIGIGIPAHINNGVVDTTLGFLPFMDDCQFPLDVQIQDRTNLPCSSDNDARLVALGEALFGAGRGFERVLCLTLGTGLGYGLVIDGRFAESSPRTHMAGHIVVDRRAPAASRPCACGQSGCLESLVRAQALLDLGHKHHAKAEGTQAILNAAAGGNVGAQAAVDDYLDRLAAGIQSYAVVAAPDVVVLGGGVALGLGPHMAALARKLDLRDHGGGKPRVVAARLGDAAGVVGAGYLAGCGQSAQLNRRTSRALNGNAGTA